MGLPCWRDRAGPRGRCAVRTKGNRVLKMWFDRPLWARVLAGMVLGLIVGLLLGPYATALKPVGDLFIRAIRMLVVPLIFVSLLAGIVTMPTPSSLGRIGVKALGIFIGTSALAVTMGIVFGLIFQPGVGTPIEGLLDADVPPPAPVSVVDLILGIVPENPINALAQGQVLPIIFFALLLGIAIIASGEQGKPLRAFLESANAAVTRITTWVLETAPFGAFALVAWVVGMHGLSVLVPLGKLILCLYAACIAHFLVVSAVLVYGYARLSLIRFYRGIAAALLVAYSTSTSSGTLPVTLRCATGNLGVAPPVASFTLSLGATINMDGTAIYMGLFALFTAQAFGVDLTWVQYAAIVFTGTLAAIGTAGIPSASLVLIPMVLGSAGLPIETIALVIGIDRIMDMMRTVVNVGGDSITAVTVAHSEGSLDREIFAGRKTLDPDGAARVSL